MPPTHPHRAGTESLGASTVSIDETSTQTQDLERVYAALLAVADAIDKAQHAIQSAQPSTRNLVDAHAAWEKNVIFTEGTSTRMACRRIGRLLAEAPR